MNAMLTLILDPTANGGWNLVAIVFYATIALTGLTAIIENRKGK